MAKKPSKPSAAKKTKTPMKKTTGKPTVSSNTKGKGKQTGKKEKVSIKDKMQTKVKETARKTKDFLFPREIFTKGKEPPKSFSFEKKFYALYILFFIYSFILLLGINYPDNIILIILTIGNPFAFSMAFLSFYVTIALLFSNDKIRLFVFEEKTAQKQIPLYVGIMAGWFILFKYFIPVDINFITLLLTLSMVWLILLSGRFYMYARKFSTKIESNFIKKYSVMRYGFALIVPFIILGILVVASVFYRSLLVFLSLDFFGPSSPANAVMVYNTEMRIIMPLIYFSLVVTLLFIIFEFVFSRSRAETRRAGTFDNFTFALIVLFIFGFQIFQITIFLIIRPETVDALKDTVGATSGTVTYIFIFEFIVSSYFLYRIVIKLGETLGWRVLFFKKDGLILFCLGCVFAQTLTRFSLSSSSAETIALSPQIEFQMLTDIGQWLMADRYIVSVLMIIFLGLTLLVYYLKPHETSMFMRLQKETVKEEDRSMDRIYKLIKSEYIRRGESYPLEVLERDLIKSTLLSKGIVHSLIKRLADKDMNVSIIEKRDDKGKMTKFIDFVSVTEQFEKKSVADKKASEYMSKRFIDTISKDKRKTIRLSKDIKKGSDKASDLFITSLTSDYRKKQKDLEERKKKVEKSQSSIFSEGDVGGNILDQIYQIARKEYIYRIENPEEYPDFHFGISQLAGQIQMATKISNVYPIFEKISKKEALQLRLRDDPETKGEKLMDIFPIADDDLCYYLSSYREDEYREYRIEITNIFTSHLKAKKTNTIIADLKRNMEKKNEDQQAWFDLLTVLYNYYPAFAKQLIYIPNRMALIKFFGKVIDIYYKKEKELNTATPSREAKIRKKFYFGE